jgi:hypothetical protein
MKWPALLIGIFWVGSLFGQKAYRQEFPAPFNFQVDSVSMMATWQPPRIILLNEDFESDIFPPSGWTDSTLGEGWQAVSSPTYLAWEAPEHPGKFVLMNDDAAGYSNNGSMDWLVTPVLDLTVADSFKLSFDSYFDAGYAQDAFLEYSIDSGATWELLLDIPAKLEWQKIEVDLSEFSGEEGESSFQLNFHADDKGYWASGWGVDNVLVASDDIGMQPEYYKIFLENRQIDQVSDTSYQYYIEYNTTRKCCIVAKYDVGVSDTVWQMVTSEFLSPPTGLVGNMPDDAAILYWFTPTIPINPYKRDFLDSVFCFTSEAVQPEGGCESDGEYVYSVFENSDSVYKLDFYGNVLEKFTIPGIPGLYDLAYVPDEDCFYGGKGDPLLYKMNFVDHTLIATYAAPVAIRALAYDEITGAFWAIDWLEDLTLFELSGEIIMTIPGLDIGNIYGLAYDYWNGGGPYLWASSRKDDVNWLSFIDVGSGQVQLSTDLSYLSQNGGLAGGLYTGHNSHFGVVLVGGNIRNDVFFGLEINPGLSGSPPDNLLGFNLYKDDEFLTYSSGYQWGAPNSYVDTLLYPVQQIKYEVEAVYDMTPYGFPGDTAESCPDEAILTVGYMIELDFFENWQNSNENLWTIPINEWYIKSNMGNGPPSSVFMPELVMNGYGSSLESWPFTVLGYPSGEVYLAYDISLSSVQQTGSEHLDVQVINYEGDEWKTVQAYSNADGSFEWIRDTVKISDYFTGSAFQIRFSARGDHSADIEYWAIDNISLTLSCEPPKNVEATLGPEPEDTIHVTWQEPWPALAEWRQWDDGVHYTTIGLGVAKDDWFGYAVRWTPEQLDDLKNAKLSAVGFIPSEISTFFILAVWTGEEKELVYTQATGNLIEGEWNVIELDEHLSLDITKDLLVGFRFAEWYCCPLSVDDGPAAEDANWFNMGNAWMTLLEVSPEFDFNWNIKAFFERDSIPLENYELYRSMDGSDYELIAEVEDTAYLDPVFNWNAEYCYALKAVYPDETCVSSLSEESCILVVSIDQVGINDDGFIQVYPIPSSGDIFIRSSEEMNKISIYNTSGMLIYDEEVSDIMKEVHLNVEPGIYFLKIVVSGKVYNKKLIVY